MFVLTKLLNLCNLQNITSYIKIYRKTDCAGAALRCYSKRFTCCENCPKPKKKRSKPTKKCTEKNAATETKECEPFQNKDTKKATKCKTQHKPRKCKPGMRNPCEGPPCKPDCKGQKQMTVDECPKPEPMGCPKGDWERE